MSDVAVHPAPTQVPSATPRGPDLSRPANPLTLIVGGAVLAGALLFVAYSIYADVAATGTRPATITPYILLFVALIIALGFEFVNGFHDTANAVATVIYTHSLPPQVAVIWSGFFNFLGVLRSHGLVAFTVVSLLPVELILQVGSSAGFAMVFALLVAAIIWNLGTWSFGLPASSSHTLIGSIIGVGVANSLLRGHGGTSGVEWSQALTVGYSLLLSPLVGFAGSAVLIVAMKRLVPNRALYAAPTGDAPPPWWIRAILIATCTGVSYAHGSNDGQKGMGLIMLILIGTVPTAYALDRTLPESGVAQFREISAAAERVVADHGDGRPAPADPRQVLTAFITDHALSDATYPSLAVLMHDIVDRVAQYGSLSRLPAGLVGNTRNDMYLASEAIRVADADKRSGLSDEDRGTLGRYRDSVDVATKFIPLWVKIAVAVALGLGTMVGWKRIVVTVGEKIGKTHLTYAQGAAAELVAAVTIAGADTRGWPVSTTHVLSSGVAGTMAANGSGLQWSTVRNIALAWVLTLPVAMVLSGSLYAIFLRLF